MRRGFLEFAEGLSGAALFVLRSSVAMSLAIVCSDRFGHAPWQAVAVAALSVAMVVGVRTRFAAILAAIVIATRLGSGGDPFLLRTAAQSLSAVALAMSGPGAFSVDAKLFGRRKVRLSGRQSD